MGGRATRAGDSGVIHNARQSVLTCALAVKQVAGVDAVQQERVARVALAVGPDGLIAQAGVGSGAGRQFRIHPRRQNGQSGETAGGQGYCLDLCTVQNVSVRGVNSIDQGSFLDRNRGGHLTHLHRRVHSCGAIGLHDNRRHPLCLEPFVGKGDGVGADGKVHEIIASGRAAGPGARQCSLVPHNGHDRSRQHTTGALHDRASDATQGLLCLSEGSECAQHAQ